VNVRRRTSAFVGLIAALTLAACTGGPSPPTSSSPPATSQPPTIKPVAVTDLDSFVSGLELGGHEVRVEQHESKTNDIFGVRGQTVSFDRTRVWAFEYPTERAAQRLQHSVNDEGSEIGLWVIDWAGQHLYRGGALIVVYLGERNSAISTLQDLLGTEFAPRP
jgi:hypothetical protein